jgi:hypothetical protein
MARRRKVDAAKVIEAVQSGRLSKDVMEEYGLEKASPPRRRRGRRPSSETPAIIHFGEVAISKRGSLALPRTMVEALGFKIDDLFIIRRTKAGLILKPSQDSEANND